MIDLASSICSSTISTMLLYPLERVKIEMQLDKQGKGATQNISIIYKKQGIKGFYQGLLPLVIGNGFSYGIYFVSYEQLKKMMRTDSHSTFSIIKSSGLAGIIATLFTNPFYVLQTKQSKEGDSFSSTLGNIILKEGVTSLWKGLLASLILVTNPIIQFAVYEFLKKSFLDAKKNPSSIIVFLLGAISKILATFATYPYTLLRTRQQIKALKQSQNIYQVLKKVIEKEGWKGLFKGFAPKLIQTTLNAALLLMFYEKIRVLLRRRFK